MISNVYRIINESIAESIQEIKEGLMSGVISEDVNQITVTPSINDDAVVVRRYKRIYVNNGNVVADIELLSSHTFTTSGKQVIVSEDKQVDLRYQFDVAQFLYFLCI